MGTTLWAMRLNRELTESEEMCLMGILPVERRERLLKLKQKEKRREPLCAYGLLYRALMECCPALDRLPEMVYGDLGKPEFAEYPELHFNISHTDGAVLVGLSDCLIGVDIEKIRPISKRMSERLGCETSELFFESWTRREARAKRTGTPVALREELPLEKIHYEHF